MELRTDLAHSEVLRTDLIHSERLRTDLAYSKDLRTDLTHSEGYVQTWPTVRGYVLTWPTARGYVQTWPTGGWSRPTGRTCRRQRAAAGRSWLWSRAETETPPPPPTGCSLQRRAWISKVWVCVSVQGMTGYTMVCVCVCVCGGIAWVYLGDRWEDAPCRDVTCVCEGEHWVCEMCACRAKCSAGNILSVPCQARVLGRVVLQPNTSWSWTHTGCAVSAAKHRVLSIPTTEHCLCVQCWQADNTHTHINGFVDLLICSTARAADTYVFGLSVHVRLGAYVVYVYVRACVCVYAVPGCACAWRRMSWHQARPVPGSKVGRCTEAWSLEMDRRCRSAIRYRFSCSSFLGPGSAVLSSMPSGSRSGFRFRSRLDPGSTGSVLWDQGSTHQWFRPQGWQAGQSSRSRASGPGRTGCCPRGPDPGRVRGAGSGVRWGGLAAPGLNSVGRSRTRAPPHSNCKCREIICRSAVCVHFVKLVERSTTLKAVFTLGDAGLKI